MPVFFRTKERCRPDLGNSLVHWWVFLEKEKKKIFSESLRNQKTFSLGVLTVVTEKHMDGGRTQQQHTHHSYKSGYISIHSMPFPWRPPGHSHPYHFLFGCSCRETGNNAIRLLTLNELAAFWVSWPRFSLVCLHTHTHACTKPFTETGAQPWLLSWRSATWFKNLFQFIISKWLKRMLTFVRMLTNKSKSKSM